MDIRNILNRYFDKTPVPDELDPRNVSKFVVPNLAEKKETQTEESYESDAYSSTDNYTVTQTSQTTPSEETLSGKKEDFPPDIIGPSAFIKIVRYHRLTGKEFLSLLGNSKISNKAYQEIENNPNLTVKRLIELLEESPLTSADYEMLIIAVQRMSQLKAEAKAKIKSEPKRTEILSENLTHNAPSENSEKTAHPKSEPETMAVISSQRAQKGYTPASTQYLSDDNDDNDKYEENAEADEEDDDRLPSAKSGIQINFGDYNDDDDDDDEEDDEEESRCKNCSNKGKIVVAAIGAVILTGISFGLRHWLTGSWLPTENIVKEETKLDEAEIYALLSPLPSPQPAFTADDTYAAGGIREESIIKDPVCGSKRLLYTENNKLYIYEQIGGQVVRLEARDYNENTLLGIIETGNKLAAVSSGVSEPYSYTCTVTSEDEEETVITGTVRRKETYLEITDASSPEKIAEENKLILSGTLVAAYLHGECLTVVTYEEMEQDSVGEDKATFMPYISRVGEKTLCSPEKVFISSPSHRSFVTIFSIDIEDIGVYDMAASAGGTKQLLYKNDDLLLIGQGSTLIRYELSEGVTQKDFCEISGNISDFSAISVNDGEIRVTTFEEDAATLTVLDGEFNLLGQIKNIGMGENLAGTCFYGKETYIVTENGACYGIDGENGVMSKSSAKITNEAIYKFNDSIGVKVSAADDGSKRTGIIVSTVKLDGNLTPLYSLEISSKTTAVNALDEYLSSPAEKNINVIGSNAENGALVIPVEYFDGVSEVELFVICTVNGDGTLSVNGKIIEYDRRSDHIFAQVDGDTVIAVTKGKIITAGAQDGNVMGYFITGK